MSDQPQHLDNLGKLCADGLDIARYLFQVPDDEGERDRVRAILKAILAQPGVKARRELPKVAQDMLDALDGEASAMAAEITGTISSAQDPSAAINHNEWLIPKGER